MVRCVADRVQRRRRADAPLGQSVTLHTTAGDMKLEVYCEEVPRTAENFLALCASGYYDGTKFHRRGLWLVRRLASASAERQGRARRNIKGFMVQGGDPTGASGRSCAHERRLSKRAGTGRGGSSIWGGKFPDEIRDTLKVRCAATGRTGPADPANAALGARHCVDGKQRGKHQRQPVFRDVRQARAPERQVHRVRARHRRAGGAGRHGEGMR